MQESEINIVNGLIEEFLQKMTVRVFSVNMAPSLTGGKESVRIEANVEDPQMLIGQNGQTLFEIQRLLTIVANKKLQKDFYLDLDINDYKKKKVEYIKRLAKETADQVILTKEKRVLPPMSSYERRIIHSELALRQDVTTESQGEGLERCVVVSLK